WGWLSYQPNSALSQWYIRRFAAGNSRLRKIGIVAVARKLLVALWKDLETGDPPEGAEVVGWDQKSHFASAQAERQGSWALPVGAEERLGVRGGQSRSAREHPGAISPPSWRRPGAHCRPLDPASLPLCPPEEPRPFDRDDRITQYHMIV